MRRTAVSQARRPGTSTPGTFATSGTTHPAAVGSSAAGGHSSPKVSFALFRWRIRHLVGTPRRGGVVFCLVLFVMYLSIIRKLPSLRLGRPRRGWAAPGPASLRRVPPAIPGPGPRPAAGRRGWSPASVSGLRPAARAALCFFFFFLFFWLDTLVEFFFRPKRAAPFPTGSSLSLLKTQ